MNKLVLYLLIVIVGISSVNAEIMTEEKLWSLKRMSDPQISPDGSYIIYSVTSPDLKENHSTTNIFISKTDGSNYKQLTTSGKHNTSGCWGPDSKSIAFLSDRTGKMQAYILDMTGGEAKQLTFEEEGISNLWWSPDGKFISYTKEVALDPTIQETYPELDKVNARLYDELPVRHWDSWQDEKYRHLFVLNLETKEIKDLMKLEKYDTPLKPFGGRNQIAWAPNGTEICYTSKKGGDFAKSTNSALYTVPAFGGKSKDITQALLGFDMEPQYSPDSKWIAFHSQERAGYESDRVRLMLFNNRSGRLSDLTEKFGQWAGNFCWAPDSRSIYFSAVDSGKSKIFEIEVSNGKWKIILEGMANYGDRFVGITSDGKNLIYSKRSFNHPAELFSYSLKDKKEKQISFVNQEAMKNIDQVKVEELWVTSSDGAKVHCWVVYPPDFDPGKKYPLITYCQGGPQQPISLYWSYGWNFQTMASQGYVIVAPNRRGCPGFGQDWVDAIAGDYGGLPMQDIMASTKALAEKPFIDNEKLAAIGASAGGYAVFWLAGNHNGLYNCFVSHCGMYNMESKYGSTEELWFPNWDNGGPYWEPQHKAFYDRFSPHKYAKNWSTPILIITGELDFRVPYTQSLEAYTAARAQGVPARLLVYPEENHWILKPQEKVLWYKEFFRFLDMHLKNK